MKKRNTAPTIAGALRKGTLTGRWRYDELMALLGAMETFDSSTGTKRIVALVLSIILILAAFFFLVMELFIPAAACGGLGLIFFILFFRYRRRDLDDDFKIYLKPLLENLKDDIKADSEIALTMSVVPTEHKRHLTKKSPKYKKGAYHTCYDTHYQRDFLSLGIRLADGNSLRLSRTDLMLKSTRTKRSSSGKSKTKNKHVQRFVYRLQMRIDPERYIAKPKPAAKGEKPISVEQTPKGPILKTAFVQKLKSGSASPDPLFTLEKLVSLYAGFKPVQEK